MVKTGASVAIQFLTSDANGALANADSAPTAVLVKNAADTGTSVTVANVTTGVYSASATMPTLAAGDIVQIRVAATIGGVTTGGLVWREDADTKYISENAGLDAAAVRAAVGLATADLDAQLAALPTAAENADATLDELLSGHAIAGSAGAGIAAAGSAGDPLLNTVPGAYAAGTAGYILGNLPDRTVNVVAPILTGQDLEFNHGYDYLAADGRSEDVTVSTWPTLTGATVVLKFGGLTWSVVSVTAATTIRIAIPRARWADIPLSEGTIQYGYVIQATLANADVVDLMTGTIRVVKL